MSWKTNNFLWRPNGEIYRLNFFVVWCYHKVSAPYNEMASEMAPARRQEAIAPSRQRSAVPTHHFANHFTKPPRQHNISPPRHRTTQRCDAITPSLCFRCFICDASHRRHKRQRVNPTLKPVPSICRFVHAYEWCLHYCSRPNAGSTFFITAPAHPHAT